MSPPSIESRPLSTDILPQSPYRMPHTRRLAPVDSDSDPEDGNGPSTNRMSVDKTQAEMDQGTIMMVRALSSSTLYMLTSF